MIKERGQNPTLGDTILLRLLTYNSNALADVYEIEKVEIFFKDPHQRIESNPQGEILVSTIPGDEVIRTSEGNYLVKLETDQTNFRIGDYIDRWTIRFKEMDDRVGVINKEFDIYRDLWYTSTQPIVYEVAFSYQPTRVIQGSRKYLRTDLKIYAPNKTQVDDYYYYLKTLNNVKIKIWLYEGKELDLKDPQRNIMLNWVQTSYRDGNIAYYLLDTSIDPRINGTCGPWPLGVYKVQFRADLGETIHLSNPYTLQVYD